MTGNPLLEIRGLHKSFGSLHVLRDLDLSVPARGGVFGLVGPNGAGKTTLFSLICGFLAPDSGRIQIDGRALGRTARVPGEMAVLAQDARFAPGISLRQLLAYYARLQGYPREAARAEAERVLALVGLQGSLGSNAEVLSHGMRKRLGIAQAFIGQPRLIILDEPTEGLDPVAAREVRQVVRTLAGDRTLLVSSHNLREIEDLCSEVAILNEGRIVRQDRVEKLVGDADEIAFHLPNPPPAELMSSFEGLGFVTAATWDQAGSRLLIRFDRARAASDQAAQALLAHLVSRGIKFSQMHVGKRLEDRFIEETRS